MDTEVSKQSQNKADNYSFHYCFFSSFFPPSSLPPEKTFFAAAFPEIKKIRECNIERGRKNELEISKWRSLYQRPYNTLLTSLIQVSI